LRSDRYFREERKIFRKSWKKVIIQILKGIKEGGVRLKAWI